MFRVLILVGLIYLGYRLYQSASGGGGGDSQFKCATCKHCARLDDDGVICRYGNRQTFKTPVHISNYMDYQKG